MLDWISFKAYGLVLYVLIITIRITLRVVYGKTRRDELIKSKKFPLYHRLKRIQMSHVWTSAMFGKSSWEPKVSKLLKSIKGELFIDVGASVGYYTLLLANNFDEVLAVEPESESVSQLRRNTRHLENIRVVQAALSNEEGEATLHVSSTLGWHTITPKSNEVYNPSMVKLLTLETLLGDRVASLVKVDTEGAELKILDGTPPGKVEAWLIEAHWGESRMRELDSKLGEMGYETDWITENHIYAH